VFELSLEALAERDLPRFEPIPRHQSVWRDIAVIAKESVTHESLMQAIRSAPTPLVRSAQLFDIYKPAQSGGDIQAGERSLAVRLEMLDDENMLTDERIEAAKAQVLETLSARLGVRLRS
jgi:phenylalanyl-tRNA synthetase beta chain